VLKGKGETDAAINVAIVAVDGFSPFHYSVPCILFGDTVSGEKRFNVTICAETPGFLTSKDGFALNATQDYTAIGQADIVVVPYWQHVLERPPQTLLDSLVQARDNGAEIVGLCLGSFVLAYAAFSTANARPRTGSSNASSSFSRTYSWISMPLRG
jgi:transcriptional regulator GlxA family with amidase domain